jgi:hypothetical protein
VCIALRWDWSYLQKRSIHLKFNPSKHLPAVSGYTKRSRTGWREKWWFQKENRSHNSVSTLRDRLPRPTPLLWSPLRLSSAVGWLVRVCVIRERKKRRLSAPFGSQPVSSGQCMGYCTPLARPLPTLVVPSVVGQFSNRRWEPSRFSQETGGYPKTATHWVKADSAVPPSLELLWAPSRLCECFKNEILFWDITGSGSH